MANASPAEPALSEFHIGLSHRERRRIRTGRNYTRAFADVVAREPLSRLGEYEDNDFRVITALARRALWGAFYRRRAGISSKELRVRARDYSEYCAPLGSVVVAGTGGGVERIRSVTESNRGTFLRLASRPKYQALYVAVVNDPLIQEFDTYLDAAKYRTTKITRVGTTVGNEFMARLNSDAHLIARTAGTEDQV